MNATEIVKRKVQSNGGLEVVQLLAEGIREPRQSAKLHPHGEILAFYVAGRNIACARMTDPHPGYNLRDSWWGIPPFVMLAIVAEQFNQLGKVNVQPKSVSDRLLIEVETVSRQLNLLSKTPVQIANESHGADHCALSDKVRRNQLGVCVLSNKNPLVTSLGTIALADLALLLGNETPNFVTLHVAAVEVMELRVQQFFASLANGFEQTHDCVPVEAGKTFRAANRAAFKKAMNRTDCRVRTRNHRVSCEFRVGFAEGGITGSAAPALDAPFTEIAEPLTSLVLASGTRHGLFSACVLREKPYNHFGSGVRLTPRSGLAPQPVRAGYGAVSCYLAIGGGRAIGFLPRFSRRAAFAPLRGSYLTHSFALRERHVSFFPVDNDCFDFPPILQTAQHSMYGSHRIARRQFVVSVSLQAIAYLRRGWWMHSRPNHGAYCVGYSERMKVVARERGRLKFTGHDGSAVLHVVQTFKQGLEAHNFILKFRFFFGEFGDFGLPFLSKFPNFFGFHDGENYATKEEVCQQKTCT
jgi:hypothetical protein